MMQLSSLQTGTSEDKKKSVQMHVLKPFCMVLLLTTFHTGDCNTPVYDLVQYANLIYLPSTAC